MHIYIFNTWGAQTCSAGSNLAVYIVGAMQLMQGISMTKHEGFLLVEPLCHLYVYIYIHVCVCVHVHVRIVIYIYMIDCSLHGAMMSKHKVPTSFRPPSLRPQVIFIPKMMNICGCMGLLCTSFWDP